MTSLVRALSEHEIMKLYANAEELLEFFGGQRETFKASYDRVTPQQTPIDIDEKKCSLEEDAFENLDVTPAALCQITMIEE